jgi:hypothetical protein
MTRTPETKAEPVVEPDLPESVSDATGGATPKIQPVLVGFVLATIIGMISAAAFWEH